MNEVPKWRAQYLAPRSVAWQQETPSPASSLDSRNLSGYEKGLLCARAKRDENEQKMQKVELTMKIDFYFIFYARRQIK